VLVVDDERAIATLVARALEDEGFHAVVCTSAAEAILRFCQGGVDLVISDVVMPDMHGPEMVRKIQDLCPSVKVIFITGYTERTVGEELKDVPFAVVKKPFDPYHLAELARRMLAPAA
jgi:two-component system cell cycle sensor histidine kinase/response regulator CckA